jgi:hypothetical protein
MKNYLRIQPFKLTNCNLVVTNKQQRRGLFIRNPTRIIDNAGNELIASQFTLGANSGPTSAKNELSTNIPLKANIIFRGAISDNIILFDISSYADGRGYFNVEFKRQ